MVVKYKLGEVAKDFNKSAKDISDLLLKFFDEPKKNQTALDSKELDIIFDVLTQENQVANFNEYFATQKPVKKVEKKPAEKKAEPNTQIRAKVGQQMNLFRAIDHYFPQKAA